MKNNLQLAGDIRRARPAVDPDAIAATVVKLRKLAKTLAKRYTGPGAPPRDVYDINTQKYFDKAYRIAHDIRCVFEAHNNSDAEGWHFYVRVDDRLERLI